MPQISRNPADDHNALQHLASLAIQQSPYQSIHTPHQHQKDMPENAFSEKSGMAMLGDDDDFDTSGITQPQWDTSAIWTSQNDSSEDSDEWMRIVRSNGDVMQRDDDEDVPTLQLASSDPFMQLWHKSKALYLNGHFKASFQVLQSIFEAGIALNQEQRVAILYNQALALHEEKEYYWCINMTEKALVLNPLHAVSLELQGDAHMEMQEFKEAEEAYRRCLRIEYNHVRQLKKNESKFRVLVARVEKYFGVLGLDPDEKDDLSSGALRQHYHRLCRQVHPDRFTESASFLQVLARQRFERIQKAYSFLKDLYVKAEAGTQEGERFHLLEFQRVVKSPSNVKGRRKQREIGFGGDEFEGCEGDDYEGGEEDEETMEI